MDERIPPATLSPLTISQSVGIPLPGHPHRASPTGPTGEDAEEMEESGMAVYQSTAVSGACVGRQFDRASGFMDL